jgi:hypothetical protein
MGGLNRARHVRRQGNSRSPVGREPHGDGAPIIVRGRESRPHGEGGQVVGRPGRGGTRHAGRRDDPGHHPREGQTPAEDPRGLPWLPHGHPCRETDTDTSDSGPGRLDIDHWRAGCGKSRTSGSEGGGRKRGRKGNLRPPRRPPTLLSRRNRSGFERTHGRARHVSFNRRLSRWTGDQGLRDVHPEARFVCHQDRMTHSRHDTRTSLAEFENASVCRTEARKGWPLRVERAKEGDVRRTVDLARTPAGLGVEDDRVVGHPSDIGQVEGAGFELPL